MRAPSDKALAATSPRARFQDGAPMENAWHRDGVDAGARRVDLPNPLPG